MLDRAKRSDTGANMPTSAKTPFKASEAPVSGSKSLRKTYPSQVKYDDYPQKCLLT